MFKLKNNIIVTVILLCLAVNAGAATLSDIAFSELPGGRAELMLTFDSPPSDPVGYAIEQPARIVLDFAGVENGLAQKKYSTNVGEVNSAVVVQGGGRTRMIVNLDNAVPYRTQIDGSVLRVEIGLETDGGGRSVAAEPASAGQQASVISSSASDDRPRSAQVNNIDFRRGELGEGKVIVDLSDPKINIDIEEVASGIEVTFLDAAIPANLRRKLDVVDFATPVNMIASSLDAGGSKISISTTGEYDYLAYQADDQYVISVKPLTRQEIEEKKKQFAYVGERLSLNFQSIAVRSVLQVLADFTGLNLVASDTVSGSITLRLKNVPWDQALDLVLKTKGLDKRKIGNVLMVAPAAEIAERERQEIETQKQLQELAPLRTEYLRVRYANARELFSLFLDAGASNDGSGGGNGTGARKSTGSILSERGQAIVDERTNSIILTDTEEKIEAFKKLVDKIDIPIRQVMIEARIVIANSDFRKELGVRLSGDAAETSSGGGNKFEATGRLEGLVNGDGAGPEAVFIDSDGDGITDDERDIVGSNLVNLAVTNPAGSFALNVLSSNFLLGMELSALQASGFAEIVSQPKVITGDKQQASIQSGTEIPYQEESASGGTTTTFKEAVLKLDVTPQITPDNRVIMDLDITQDSISGIDQASNIPILDITQLQTQVLVADGETIVLGGIYQTETITGETKVPLLGDIPYLGRLFKNNVSREDKRELLLFITPRIMSADFVE